MMVAPNIKPMPRTKRRITFFLLVFLFICAIPFLYLYATGYRFEFADKNLVSTGGIFIAAEQKGVEIYVDDVLERETRAFNKAFYAQNINPGTHRVHVQKDGYHTWVKELPVYPHLVTEVQAFNMPLTPQAHIITRYLTSDTRNPVVLGGVPILASTTETLFTSTSTATTSYAVNTEFVNKLDLFDIAPKATSTLSAARVLSRIEETASSLVQPEASSTLEEQGTTTKTTGGVRLFERDGEVYAFWAGSRENMPYYYCAAPFESLKETQERKIESKDRVPGLDSIVVKKITDISLEEGSQTVATTTECIPEIRIDRKWQTVKYFDFFPGSTDFVLMVLEDGVYMVEVDNRSWQNVQPILLGKGLTARVDGGKVIVFDGTQFYEMIFEVPEA